jgi:2-desacetyl-2-hydroxyethyl bacteriochlorophyllide A dehydrogenase
MKIKAGLVTAPFEGGLAELEGKDPGPVDVVIRTEYSFVSNGTEQHTHRREFPEPPAGFPMVMGYQCAGRIERVGGAVKGFGIGQRVFTRQNSFVGVSNPIGGVHAERVVTAAGNLIPIPDGVDPMEASALVIAQVGYNTAYRFPESRGKTAMVIGDGLIGQFTAQVLVARGFRVLLSGHHDYRLDIAKAACPELCVANSASGDFEKRLKDFAGDRVDMAVDSVGSPATMAECFRRVRPLGHVAISGYMGGNQVLSVHQAFAGESTVHFPAGANRERLVGTLEMIQKGAIKVAPLVTHKLDGADFGQACRLLGSKDAEYLGIALAW